MTAGAGYYNTTISCTLQTINITTLTAPQGAWLVIPQMSQTDTTLLGPEPGEDLRCTHSLHLLQDSVLDVDVLKHSFDHHVGLLKAAVIQLTRQVGQDGVPLERRDALLFGLGVEPGLAKRFC